MKTGNFSNDELIKMTWGVPVSQSLQDEWLSRFRRSADNPETLQEFLRLTIEIGGKLNKERGLDEHGNPAEQ